MFGRRYVLPRAVAAALEGVFEEPADGVIVIERPRYAQLHRDPPRHRGTDCTRVARAHVTHSVSRSGRGWAL
jgi:hypothetical protein